MVCLMTLVLYGSSARIVLSPYGILKTPADIDTVAPFFGFANLLQPIKCNFVNPTCWLKVLERRKMLTLPVEIKCCLPIGYRYHQKG